VGEQATRISGSIYSIEVVGSMHIREFQDMMQRLYFHRDSKRGSKGTHDWLVDETRELGEALENGNKEELEKEFADVIAWLASLANVVNVDLEKAALSKYNDKCPKCKCSPCQCTS
jgi:NTP pyrophosphatase (non-canonical NTP hydrolase)